jgi:hypothetical protein
MKTLVNNIENYSLQNIENYKNVADFNTSEAIKKYYELIFEYLKFVVENIKIKKQDLLKFIIIRGLDTITNVFLNVLYFTKNINLTYFHSQKSYYFYVEFVGQISDEEKIFLQLTSRDATIYVYKKTIFEINSEYKKTNEDTSIEFKDKLNIIKSYINLYQTYLLKMIQSDNIDTSYITSLSKLCDKLNNITNKSKINFLENIIEKLYSKIENNNVFFEINNLLVKKFLKNTESLKYVEKKINLDEFNDKLLERRDKFISWFLSC